MDKITATYQAGRVDLPESVNWPDGTQVEVRPLQPSQATEPDTRVTHWPQGFFDDLRASWGQEPFERPPQGGLESRENW